MSNETRYLSIEEVIAINTLMIQKFSPKEDAGIRDIGLLESAVNRPKQIAFGADAYQTIYEKASALFVPIGQNHPFHNANKRTAFSSLALFLKFNGYNLHMDKKEAENFTVDMVKHEYTFDEMTKIIEVNSRGR